MSDSKLFNNYSINLNIEDSSASQSFFSFFSSKKEILSICPYKDNIMILMNDYSLINYDIFTKTKKLEIKELDKYNPIEITILYYQIPIFDKDYLLVLCENSFLLLNITSFITENNIPLKDKPISMELFILNNTYFLSILTKYKIILYTVEKTKNKQTLNFILYQEIKSDNGEKIISERLFLYKNLIGYQTDTKIIFLTFKTNKNLNTQTLVFDKQQNFQRQIPNFDELNTLRKNLDILYKKYNVDKFKNIDLYKNIVIEYTPMNNYFIFSTYNRLFIIKSFYDFNNECIEEIELNNSKTQSKLKILDKIAKPNIILLNKIIDPYLCLIYDEKIFVFLISDYNKCIYNTNIDPNYNLLFYKPIPLLKNLHLLDYQNDVINYNDELLLKEISKKKKEDLTFNSRPIIYMFYNKDNLLNYFSFGKLLLHLETLKKIKTLYSSKLLSILDYNRSNNMQYYDKELEKRNRKFIGYKVIELYFDEININNYENGLNIFLDNNMNIIFILILIKSIVKSKHLNNLLILYLYEYIYKISFEYEQINLKININQDENSNDKDNFISTLIKYFFNTLMLKRNEIKNNFTPQELKLLSFEVLIDELNIKRMDNKINIGIDSYKQNIEIIKLIEKKKEDMIVFILLENVLFILNYYSYKINKDNKFLSNLYGLIKMSVNILDPYIIDLLKEINLNSLILLYYYSKGNYGKCFYYINSFYDSSPSDEKNEKIQYDYLFDDKLSSNKSRENKPKKINTDGDKNKAYWFKTYIYLISKIFSKLSEKEFCERIKWALTNNSLDTIDLLINYKIIDDKKINYSFIDLLKPYGLDPIIYYFGKFTSLEGGKAESNEIINLYSIKIKLLSQENESKDKEKEGKFIQEIEETRNKLCKFLIVNKNYDVNKAYDRILNDIGFCEKEIGILLIKLNNYEAGINKIMNFNNNENYLIELLFLLVEELPCFELVNIIITKLKDIKFINHTIEQIILQILNKLGNNTDILIKILNSSLLDEYHSEEITDFFIENIYSLERKILYNKIEASLIGSQILDTKNILYDLQSESVLINYKTMCNKCNKCIYDKPLFESSEKNEGNYGVKTSDGKIYHLECFNNL